MFIGPVFIFLMIGVVSTFAGTGSAGAVDGQGVNASFNNPQGIDFNQTDGCLYIVDQGNHRIRKITPQGIVTMQKECFLLFHNIRGCVNCLRDISRLCRWQCGKCDI